MFNLVRSPSRALIRLPCHASPFIRRGDRPAQAKRTVQQGWGVGLSVLLVFLAGSGILLADDADAPPASSSVLLSNVASVRELSVEVAGKGLPVLVHGVVTFAFDRRACFVQDPTAGIFVGNGNELPLLNPGDVVELRGVSGAGEFAPIIQPEQMRIVGHTNLPPPRSVSYDELVTGRQDSQWVEVVGLVRAVFSEPEAGGVLEIAAGGGRLTAFVPSASESELVHLVDGVVRLRGVCGTWFNKQRQLFGIRLMVSRTNDIVIMEAAPAGGPQQALQPIGNLLRFSPRATETGRRAKVGGTVILHQPGRALFVQDDKHGLYVQTRQSGELRPGDVVELLGFPAKGDYTPMLQDAIWRKSASGPAPNPVLVRPDEALGGLLDARLVAIEGRLLDRAVNYNELMLLMDADDRIFSAQLEATEIPARLSSLQNGSRLRLTGVCRIEVGEQWRAGPNWRAKAFRILLRSPADVEVIELPPWWTLRRALWAVGLLIAAVIATLVWVTQLHRKVSQQTEFIRKQRDVESGLKERYQDLFENANDMVYTHELSGRLTSINMAGERLLGRSRSEIVGRSVTEFITEDQRQHANQWLEQIVDGAAPPTVEWDFIAATGQRVRLEISTRLIAREGRQVEVEGIARDVTERRRLENEILEISTREQRRIGHDLHDGVCQQLAGIAFLSETLADRLEEEKRPEAHEAQKITELVNQANKQTRGVARGLFPVRLEENGLVSALEELAVNAGAFFNVKCEFHAEAPVTIRDHTVAHHLYYIAQESILNAVKHGKARLIQIRLGPENPDHGVLTVRDNGQGFLTPGPETRGMGIRIMKYRARLIRATVQVGERPEGGVEVACHFPGDGNVGNTSSTAERPLAVV